MIKISKPRLDENAVVYQIFPDRFYDGNRDNNRAKLVMDIADILERMEK